MAAGDEEQHQKIKLFMIRSTTSIGAIVNDSNKSVDVVLATAGSGPAGLLHPNLQQGKKSAS
eukprot:m.1137014 g.1137014  ORF g.1137014 m.1137014 type:complete len:62 (-) comp24434_c1_seq1:688-873(-)